MMHVRAIEAKGYFKVVGATDRSQAATMILGSHESTGSETNEHPQSDQWLYVITGRGRAVVEEEEIELEVGTLLLIEAGEAHEIVNTGDVDLVTLNVYAPPAY